MNRTEEFQELRPLLFSIAYRILGSVSEAEDAVQETWLRFEGSPTEVRSPKAFLSAAVTRISIDVLRSARVQAIRLVLNPDKLAHMGPVADAWAVSEQLRQARRTTN